MTQEEADRRGVKLLTAKQVQRLIDGDEDWDEPDPPEPEGWSDPGMFDKFKH